MSLDELVYDSNTPVERKLIDLESRFHLMCLAPSRRDLTTFFMDRFDIASIRARANAEVLRGRKNEDGLQHELDRLYGSLIETVLIIEEMAGRRSRGPDMPWIVDTIRLEIEEMVSELLQDATAVRHAIDIAVGSMDSEKAPLLDRGLKVIREAVNEVGLERQEMLRDARASFDDLLNVPGAPSEPVLWFLQGWLSWMRRLDPTEVRELFFRACLGGSMRKDEVFWLSCRYLAFVQFEMGSVEDAYISIRQALAVRADPETLMEGSRYAFGSGREDNATMLLRRCLDQSPLQAVIYLSQCEVEL